MKVRDIMSQPAKTIHPFQTVEEAAEHMALHDVGALVVTDADQVVGIVTDRDIVVRCLAQGLAAATTTVRRAMTSSPTVIEPDESVSEAGLTLTNLRVRRLPVVEAGRLVGMVSSDDIVRHSDNEDLILLMVRRVAPRRTRQTGAAAS